MVLNLLSLYQKDKTIESTSYYGLENSDPANSGRLRIADINTDGFPDILVTAKFSQPGSTANTTQMFTRTYVLLNYQKDMGDEPINKNYLLRTFAPVDAKSYYYKVT